MWSRGLYRFVLTTGFLVTGLSTPTLALDPKKPIGQFVQSSWTNEDGLPQSSVQAILQTHDGYLWLGTQEGVARFDGVRFTVFDKSNTKALKSSSVWALAEGRDGSLWIGTDGGITRLLRGSFTTYSTKDGLSSDLVRSIHEDREGTLWIGTDGGGLTRFSKGVFSRFGVKEGLPWDRVRPICEDHEGNIWVGSMGGGLARIARAGSVTLLGTAQGLPSDRVAALCLGRNGTLWVGTLGGGVARLQDGRFTVFGTREGLASPMVWSLFLDRDGSLWIGTELGLSRAAMSPGNPSGGFPTPPPAAPFRSAAARPAPAESQMRIESFGSKEGLPADRVWALSEDREKNLWIGTDGGLVRLREGKFQFFGAREGLSSDVAISVMEDRAGRVWIGTSEGLTRIQNGLFTRFDVTGGLPNSRVWALLEDRAGRLWIGTDGGLAKLENGKFTSYGARDGLPSERIRCLLEDHEGGLWAGTLGGGVARLHLHEVRFTAYTTTDGLSSNRVRCLLEDHRGDVWIGTTGGLTCYSKGKLRTYTAKNGLPNDLLLSLHEDAAGVLWMGTYGGGLLRFQEGRFSQISSGEGLSQDVVFQILPDATGGFWMSSNKGIFRVARKELMDVADGRAARVTSTLYDKGDGMPNSECDGGSQPAGWKTRDGRLWFPTVKGVVVIDPARIPVNSLAPPVIIEELRADQRVFPVEKPVVLPPGTGRLEIHYTAPSLIVPKRVKFQYQLEGLDPEWVEAGTRRAAYYTSLPPGDYKFRVRACNDDGVWNSTGVSLSVTLKPFFRQTMLFKVLLALALLLAGLFTHRWRIYRLKIREEELKRLVYEKTRSLEEAQEKIAHLADSASEALLNIPAWSGRVAEDLARTIGAEDIGVFLVEKESLSSLTQTAARRPSLDELRSASGKKLLAKESETVIPVTGISGELLGALVVSGKEAWEDEERRLVLSFAHQLGGALEVQKMKRELGAAGERRSATRREMLDRGVDILQICPRCGRCYDQRSEHCSMDGRLLESPRLLPYRILGRYRLSKLLGEGGMGTVYEAQDTKLDRPVALKIIRAERFDDRFRFAQEPRAIARIQHPGVIALHDSGELDDGSAFLVMERLRGKDLGEVIREYGRGTPSQVATLLEQIGAALKAAHRAGIIHRDIKPANVFLTATPEGLRVKVLDFGLAKSMKMETALTQTGMVIGTPSYMSPEQLLGREVQVQSDVYSLATVAYEALTGHRLVAAEEFAEICAEVLSSHPPAISSFQPGIPAEVDEVFARALAKNPKDRPEDVEVWVASLTKILETLRADSDTSGWPLSFGEVSQKVPALKSDEPTRAMKKG